MVLTCFILDFFFQINKIPLKFSCGKYSDLLCKPLVTVIINQIIKKELCDMLVCFKNETDPSKTKYLN